MNWKSRYAAWTQRWRQRRWLPGSHLQGRPEQAWGWQVVQVDRCLSAVRGKPWGKGWYQLSLRLTEAEQTPSPRLYLDRIQAGGVVEQTALALPLDEAGRIQRKVLLLPQDTDAIHFDPGLDHGRFSLPRLYLRRISRARAALLLGWDLLRQPQAGESRRYLPAQAWRQWRQGGRPALAGWLLGRASNRHAAPLADDYQRWLLQCDQQPLRPAPAEGASALQISIIVPVYNTPARWLSRCIESVLAQTCAQWQLCICDDASSHPDVAKVLARYADHPQIAIHRRTRNGHISEASNDAIALASGEYLALLDHDDELHPQAIQEVVAALLEHPEWKIIYSDEDKLSISGARMDPYFKPDWNPELIFGQNFVSHLGVYETAMVRSLGGFRRELEGSQDWDLLLRCSESLQSGQIGHLPRVLYHWRMVPGSTARNPNEKNYAALAAERAVVEALQRQAIPAEVSQLPAHPGYLRVRYALPEPVPKVSLIIPTRDGLDLLSRCVSSVLQRTRYSNYDILIVDNDSVQSETLAYLQSIQADPRVRVLRYPHPFNYSSINNAAVAACDGSIIGLLNNDIEVISPDWLDEMVSHAVRPAVGAVGAMLYFPDDTIQHAGIVLGVHGVAVNSYRLHPRHDPGQMGRAKLTQAMMAVTAACLLIRREVYLEVGGLDPELQVAFNDVDFCLRVDARGYRNVWTPFAELYHHESASRGEDDDPVKQARFQGECDFMLRRWDQVLRQDRSYNPNLTLAGEPYGLAWPPRGRWPGITGTTPATVTAMA